MIKKVPEEIKGSPIHLDLEIQGDVYSFELVCPMCGEKNFAISQDYTLGGCINQDCDCICLLGMKDTADMKGVGWII